MDFSILDKISPLLTEEEKLKKSRMLGLLEKRYKDYKDPWGFDLKTVFKAIDVVLPIYLKYFKVRVFGKENIKDTPYIVTSNHTGQIPIDGMLITLAMAYDMDAPRVCHSMVDRFVMTLPFIADFYSQTGAILGDRSNSEYLLSQKESILVFPEGVKGVSKNTPDFYKLQNFTNGFFRIALKNNTPILPVAVVGAEEMFPFVFHTKLLSSSLGIPSIPLMTNYFPLPSPIDIYFGEPYTPKEKINHDCPDHILQEHICHIEKEIQKMIKEGLKERRPFLDSVRNPLTKFIKKSFK